MQLPNGQSARHPSVDQFIDSIRERFSHAITVYEKTPLGKMIVFLFKMEIILLLSVANISGERVEVDSEARRALNFIEAGTEQISFTLKMHCFVFFVHHLVVQLHTQIFSGHTQPVKNAIIRIFPYVRTSISFRFITNSHFYYLI